jgi:hypothetical protein
MPDEAIAFVGQDERGVRIYVQEFAPGATPRRRRRLAGFDPDGCRVARHQPDSAPGARRLAAVQPHGGRRAPGSRPARWTALSARGSRVSASRSPALAGRTPGATTALRGRPPRAPSTAPRNPGASA